VGHKAVGSVSFRVSVIIMVTSLKEKQVKPRHMKKRGLDFHFRKEAVKNKYFRPIELEEAYLRPLGPYTAQNSIISLEEEPIELYNGWLVWKEMTDPEERHIAANIQEILTATARAFRFGQAYPDQFSCLMANKNVLKPDVCVISRQRFERLVAPVRMGSKHKIMWGSPELVIEIRSPSNLRSKEKEKRQNYFENGALTIWDVDPEKRKIWVYEAEDWENATEYGEEDTITCERLFPGWQRLVADFFSKDLTLEYIVGEPAKQWRTESKAEGRAEGKVEGRAEGKAEGRAEGRLEGLRIVLLYQAHQRFEAEKLPTDLEARLERYTMEQLIILVGSITTSVTLEEWLSTFPS